MASEDLVQVSALCEALLGWYDRHKRDLPWRRTRDPYAIWVSEIMLQQTRVAAVLEHYARWMARFPSVGDLALAEEPEVLALWSGLGYYRRARFLHAGARAVVGEHAGVLPHTADGLRLLPGIGEYTSAAIASIAFDEAVAVVDGNVERVIMRLYGLSLEQPGIAPTSPADNEPASTKKTRALKPHALSRSLAAAPLAREIRMLARRLLAPGRPGDFNQSMMELGATVCLPRAPLCLQCPVYDWCLTRGEHIGALAKPMQSRSIVYALAERERGGEREVLLTQRPADASLMPGMWELPELTPAPPGSPSTPIDLSDPGSTHAITPAPLLTLRHSITITNYTVQIVAFLSPGALQTTYPSARWTAITQLPETALTGLTRKALKRLALWPHLGSPSPQG